MAIIDYVNCISIDKLIDSACANSVRYKIAKLSVLLNLVTLR